VNLTPTRLATILRTYEPDATVEEFRARMAPFIENDRIVMKNPRDKLTQEDVDRLYVNYDPQRFTLGISAICRACIR